MTFVRGEEDSGRGRWVEVGSVNKKYLWWIRFVHSSDHLDGNGTDKP